jgi:hypothetical protein
MGIWHGLMITVRDSIIPINSHSSYPPRNKESPT